MIGEPRTVRKPRTWIVVLLFVLSLVTTICLAVLFAAFSFRGFVDFPCFARVEDGYLTSMDSLVWNESGEIDPSVRAILFVDIYPAHMSGGGCRVEMLADGESVDFGNYTVQVNGDALTVDGTVDLAPGEETANREREGGWNPWWWYEDYYRLSNRGLVTGVRDSDGVLTDFDHALVIGIGAQGSQEKVRTITVVIFGAGLLGTVFLGVYLLLRLIVGGLKRLSARSAGSDRTSP